VLLGACLVFDENHMRIADPAKNIDVFLLSLDFQGQATGRKATAVLVEDEAQEAVPQPMRRRLGFGISPIRPGQCPSENGVLGQFGRGKFEQVGL